MLSTSSHSVGKLAASFLTAAACWSAGAAPGSAAQAPALAGVPTPPVARVARDPQGVAHVFAATDAGAYRGAGYAAAEDRFFQMSWMRLVVQGRVSEFFGSGPVVNPLTGAVKKTHVISDRKARTLGWTRHARKVVAALDPETRGMLAAYADGVNTWIHDPGMAPDPLFAQYGVPIEDWTPEDCVAAWLRLGDYFGASGLDEARLMHGWQALQSSTQLTHRQKLEELTGALVCDDTAAVIQESDLSKPERDRMYDYALAHGLDTEDACLPYQASPHFSQAWAVAGSRVSTGRAVLVGDPRIGVTMPSQLYEWSMVGATFAARGVGVPGCPNLLSGSSGQVAWSPTALGLDQSDLMLLSTDPALHPGRYRLDGQWVPFSTNELETIHVRGESDVHVQYQETFWGPVVTGLCLDVHAGEEYAMHRVPFFDPSGDPSRGFLAMYRAGSVATFFDALDGWTWPSVNLVFADSGGHIAYSIAGSVPVRNPALDLAGIIAQDGSTSSSEWLDLLPNELKPHVFDPASGFVYSANHRPIGAWYPIPIRFGSGGFGDTFRSRRLRERLTQSPSTMAPLQVLDFHHDVVSVAARDLTEIGSWLKLHSSTPLSLDARRALTELAPWYANGALMDNSMRGTLVASRLDLSFRAADAGDELVDRYGGGESGLNLFLKQALAKIRFVPPIMPTPAEIAYVDKVLADALQAALAIGPTNVWQSWYLQNELTVALPRWTSIEGFPSLAPGAFAPIGTFRAVDQNTLLSPLHQSYTQFLEVGAPGRQFSVAPPGGAEPISSHDVDQVSLWTSEQLKPSPLTITELKRVGVVSWKLL